MIGKNRIFLAILLLLLFFPLSSAWVWAQEGGGGGGDSGSSGGGTTTRERTSTRQRPAERPRPMYLSGLVLLDDGQIPEGQVRIELLCRGTVVRQEYTSHSGTFNLEISSGASGPGRLQPMDASVSTSAYSSLGGTLGSGSQGGGPFPSVTIQRRQVDLSACEVRALLPGYQSDLIRLGRRRVLDSPDIGVIVLHRLDGTGGGTISLKTLAAPKKAKEAYEKAGKEFTRKKPDISKAVKELEKAVEIYPEFAAAWYMLGEVHLVQKDRPAASEAFEHAKAADSAYVNPYLSLALMALEEERWEEAADLCSQALELSPQLIKAHYYNALAHSSLGRIDIAEESALLVQEKNQAQIYPLVYYVLGFAEAERGDFPAAAARYQTFLEIRPDSSISGRIREQLAQWQEQGLL